METYYVSYIHCADCVEKIKKAVSALPGVKNISLDMKTGKMDVAGDGPIGRESIAKAVEGAGRWRIVNSPAEVMHYKKPSWLAEKLKLYRPLIIVFAIIIAWTAARAAILEFDAHQAMHDFMGAFFLAFGTLKVLSWKKFSMSFREYDPVAARSRAYAAIYPLIEIFLGVAYQFRFNPELLFNAMTIVILGFTSVGVIKKLSAKEEVRCACLGGFFNIPVTWVTVAENAVMIAMAAAMPFV